MVERVPGELLKQVTLKKKRGSFNEEKAVLAPNQECGELRCWRKRLNNKTFARTQKICPGTLFLSDEFLLCQCFAGSAQEQHARTGTRTSGVKMIY